MKLVNNLQTAHEIEQFYFREARMLDERKFQSWMELLAPGIEYVMPNRRTAASDANAKFDEAALSTGLELDEHSDTPLRYDDMMTLSLRCNRPTNPLAWSDNPLARTRRLVGNVEPYWQQSGVYCVYSNTLLSFGRHDEDNVIYSYQRQDELQRKRGDYLIRKRRIVMNWNLVAAPTVALIF